MKPNSPAFRREMKTLRAMISIYCRRQHGSARALCPECAALESYALERLTRCPYGEQKPNCAACPIHCYQPARREQAQRVMRFAGPLMLRSHPVLALRHLLRKWRKAPARSRRAVA